MAELLVFAATNTDPDPTVDARDMWKRGMIVDVKPDGHVWGKEEHPATASPAKFGIVRLPGVPVSRVLKYLTVQTDIAVPSQRYRRRLWQIQFSEMPAGVRGKLSSAGVLTIAASGGDFTWAQAKDFFARLDTDARETADVTVG